ncbi:formate antiporter, partial [Moniliophthora roreri]
RIPAAAGPRLNRAARKLYEDGDGFSLVHCTRKQAATHETIIIPKSPAIYSVFKLISYRKVAADASCFFGVSLNTTETHRKYRIKEALCAMATLIGETVNGLVLRRWRIKGHWRGSALEEYPLQE